MLCLGLEVVAAPYAFFSPKRQKELVTSILGRENTSAKVLRKAFSVLCGKEETK